MADMAKAKPEKPLPTWRITLIAKKGRYLGTVRAATAEAAIEVAIRHFGITDPQRRKRLAAQPVADS